MEVMGIDTDYPIFLGFYTAMPLLMGPLIYLYILSYTNISQRFNPLFLLHALPYLFFTTVVFLQLTVNSGGSVFEDKNIKKGDKVLIYSFNSADYATVLWACATSGVIAVPIDFNNNFEFVKKIYAEVGASSIFCSVLKDPLCGDRIFFESLGEYYDKDLEGFASNYKIKDDDAYELNENELNQIGYQLMGSDQLEEALEVFKLYIKAFPKSSNAYDSYAEALMKLGRNDEAEASIQKVLKTNPNFNVEKYIKRLPARSPEDMKYYIEALQKVPFPESY